MLIYLISFIESAIFDYTIPRLYETIDDYKEYDPNMYNYDLIHKEFDIDECLQTNKHRLNECIKYSMKKFYNPISILSQNNITNNRFFPFLITNPKPQKNKKSINNHTKYQQFWFLCSETGNKQCSELYNTFNFFNEKPQPKKETNSQNYQTKSSIFNILQTSHYLMYRIDSNRQEKDIQNESEKERSDRFQKAYELLKPVAFLAFEKYLTDHFGSLRPLRRINQTLVEDQLGYRTAYKHELKIILEGKSNEKDISYLFKDLIYPEVARLFNDIVRRRKERPEFPLNRIYSNLLFCRFPFVFERNFRVKENFQKIVNHLHRGGRKWSSNYDFSKDEIPVFGDFYIKNHLFQSEDAENYTKVKEKVDDDDDEEYYYDIDDGNNDEPILNDSENEEKELSNEEEIINSKFSMDKEHLPSEKVQNEKNSALQKVEEFNENENSNSNAQIFRNEKNFSTQKDDEINMKSQNFEKTEKSDINSKESKLKINENERNEKHQYSNENEYGYSNENEEEFYEYDSEDDSSNYHLEIFYDPIQKVERQKRQLFYNYNLNVSDNISRRIFIEKKKNDFYSHQLIDYIFSIYNDDYEIRSAAQLGEVIRLCENYLLDAEDVESYNQSNLTTKISTIYGIEALFGRYHRNSGSISQYLKKVDIFDRFDSNGDLNQCKFVDEGIYYLIHAAKNGEIKAVEALIFKFILMMNEVNDSRLIDEYFDYVLNEFSDFYDDSRMKSNPPNFYVHFHEYFSPFVADFFDSIIFFDNRLRDYFQVDKITYFNKTYPAVFFTNDSNETTTSEKVEFDDHYSFKNPRNWTFEDAAKALRRFIDASFLVQSGHLAEISLSSPSSFAVIKPNIGRFRFISSLIRKIFEYFYEKVATFVNEISNSDKKNDQQKHKENMNIDKNKEDENDEDDDEITVNEVKINKRSFFYALRVYQTLALSGNRDAMWNAHILMKAAKIPNQRFIQFITDSNETVFLHELDSQHRRKQHNFNFTSINESNEEKKLENKNNDNNNKSNRSLSSLFTNLAHSIFCIFGSVTNKSMAADDQIDYGFYEEISDLDPYAAFALSWKKRDNLTAAFELLDKTEKMKPDSKVAVVISKMIIATLSFINSVFGKKLQDPNHRHASVNSSSVSSNIFEKMIGHQQYERIGEIVKSTPYLPEILMGSGILFVLAFLIYIRISLYCD